MGGSEGGPPPAPSGAVPERRFAEVLADRGSAAPSESPATSSPGRAVAPAVSVPLLDDDIAPAPKAAELSRQKAPPAGAAAEMYGQGQAPRGLQEVGERAGRPPALEVPTSPAAPDAPLTWQRVASGAFDAEKRVDAMIEAAQKGKSFSAQELLGLQVEVFRYSQTVEMVSHATDKLVGAIKQTLGTQV